MSSSVSVHKLSAMSNTLNRICTLFIRGIAMKIGRTSLLPPVWGRTEVGGITPILAFPLDGLTGVGI